MAKAKPSVPAKKGTADKAIPSAKAEVILCDLHVGSKIYKTGTPVTEIKDKDLINRLKDKDLIGSK